MIERMHKRFASSTAKWWLSIGALLGVGMLPCPECGAPMILHFWPLAAMVLALRAMKRRYRREQPSAERDKDRENGQEKELHLHKEDRDVSEVWIGH